MSNKRFFVVRDAAELGALLDRMSSGQDETPKPKDDKVEAQIAVLRSRGWSEQDVCLVGHSICLLSSSDDARRFMCEFAEMAVHHDVLEAATLLRDATRLVVKALETVEHASSVLGEDIFPNLTAAMRERVRINANNFATLYAKVKAKHDLAAEVCRS